MSFFKKSIIVVLTFIFFSSIAFAAYEKISPGESITIGEFVYDDDYTPTTTPCTISISDTDGTLQVNEASMTSLANGWHYYQYSVSPSAELGIWPTFITCGSISGGDLIKADKSFVVEQVLSTTTIWEADNRTLTDYSTSTLVSSIWNASGRSLTTFGSLASDVWSDVYAPTRRLTSSILSGGGSLATLEDLGIATSSIVSEILTNRTTINNLNNISASDVWSYATRDLTNYATSSITDAVWDRAYTQLTTAGSIGKLLADNIDAQISSRGTSSLTAAEVWATAERTLTDYSTSTIAQAVWQNSTRSLTEGLITAQEVWDVLVSSLNTVDSVGKLVADSLDVEVSSRASLENQIAGWNVSLSDFTSVQAGETYRAKLIVLNATSSPQNPYSTPEVTVYDAERNIVVSSVPMTSLSTGIYEYTYSVPSSGAQGVWETVVETEIESGKTITRNDYWSVSGSPAQVIINSVTGTVPNAVANLTITNEGLAGYEYQYEWCVVSTVDNTCGGGDDIYRGTGAKFINPGEDWNTNLTATVPTAGSYYFKVIVYFGTESSGSSRTFTISEEDNNDIGGGGGGGGGSSTRKTSTNKTADLNIDGLVNSIDFSILLSFWKTNPPFKNTRVDINKDTKVDSVDFSIMLSQWDK